ncbi:hypothetical protein V3F60_004065 [Salmonella enterica]
MNGSVVFPNGKGGVNKGRLNLGQDETGSTKKVPTSKKNVVMLIFGGAADVESYYTQGPNNNTYPIFKRMLKYLSEPKIKYIIERKDYSAAKGKDDITRIKALIPTTDSYVYIIGHSLGGWNGAHLSQILSDSGYKVSMLVTLDPVGHGVLVSIGSDIYNSEPKPVSDEWINILCSPTHPNSSDGVAEFGERWIVSSGPSLNESVDVNHAYADNIFTAKLSDGKSAYEHVTASIDKLIGSK